MIVTGYTNTREINYITQSRFLYLPRYRITFQIITHKRTHARTHTHCISYTVSVCHHNASFGVLWRCFMNIRISNPSGAETGIFRANKNNAMAADALTPSHVARSSAAMLLWYAGQTGTCLPQAEIWATCGISRLIDNKIRKHILYFLR